MLFLFIIRLMSADSILPGFLSFDPHFTSIFPNTSFKIINDIIHKEKSKCPICLTFSLKIFRPNSCNHSFCQSCLKKWLNIKNNCPICRKSFSLILNAK